MTTLEMLDLLTQRTKIVDKAKLLRELRVAYRWAVNEVFKSADGPQLLMVIGEEITLNATTRDYDLESNLGSSLLGIQTLWAKLPSATTFTRLIPKNATDDEFVTVDGATTADPLISSGYPIFYAVMNDGQNVRFAPALPATTVIRVDYAKLGAAPDPTTNPTQEDGTDIPSIFHDAIVYQAAVPLCITLDDTRATAWAGLAVSTLNSAIYAASRGVHTQQPIETRGFRRRNRRRAV
jgi:hypothetical protein